MKILFTTTPRLGPFLAMVPLIRAVRAAGHQARVATSADLAPAVRRYGFDLWPLGPEAQVAARQLVPMARAWRPDVVVREPPGRRHRPGGGRGHRCGRRRARPRPR